MRRLLHDQDLDVTITRLFTTDHDRLDELLREVVAMVNDGELERAAAWFRDFDEGLREHIDIEERLLFPSFERVTGVTMGPTEVMRLEHRLIVQLLATVGRALDRADARAFRDAHAELAGTLAHHNLKEERVLYPALDYRLEAEERRDLVARARGWGREHAVAT